jgi:hypothetical protein
MDLIIKGYDLSVNQLECVTTHRQMFVEELSGLNQYRRGDRA